MSRTPGRRDAPTAAIRTLARVALVMGLSVPSCLEPDLRAPVGVACDEDGDCSAGRCLRDAEGFPWGYCSAHCSGDSFDSPLDAVKMHAACTYVKGGIWLVSYCHGYYYDYDRDGYVCSSSTGYGGVILPSCIAADEDCRGCGCPLGRICSFSGVWRCESKRGAGSPCRYGGDECLGKCLWDTEAGEGRCVNEDDTRCVSNADCTDYALPTCSTSNQFVQICDEIVPGLHYFEPCQYEPATGSTVQTGECYR